MRKIIWCLLLQVLSLHVTLAAPPSTNTASPVLILENSTLPLMTAKATLIVSPLTRTNGVYAGDFKVKIFPYFFRSDRGRLAINVSDTALAAVYEGKTVVVSGTSTSTKNGTVRHIEITATPKDRDHGTINLWFMVGDQKMIFTPAYHFTNEATASAAPLPHLPLASAKIVD